MRRRSRDRARAESGGRRDRRPRADDGRPGAHARARDRIPALRLLADGTLRDENDVFGRIEADGTLRRADGSACLRVDRSGAIAIVPPSRARNDHGIGFHIDGDALVMIENERSERIMEVVDGSLVLELERNEIAGLTPEYHRTALAAHALYFMLLLAESDLAYH